MSFSDKIRYIGKITLCFLYLNFISVSEPLFSTGRKMKLIPSGSLHWGLMQREGMGKGHWGEPSTAQFSFKTDGTFPGPKAASGLVTGQLQSHARAHVLFSRHTTGHFSLGSRSSLVWSFYNLSLSLMSLSISYSTISSNPCLGAKACNVIREKDLEIISAFHPAQSWAQGQEGKWIVSWQKAQSSPYPETCVQMTSKRWPWFLIWTCVLRLALWWSVNKYNFHRHRLCLAAV